MIDSIGKITLYVNNQNEARDFWTEKMGFIVRLEQQMGADQKWLEVGPEYGGGTSFVLYDKDSESRCECRPSIYYFMHRRSGERP